MQIQLFQPHQLTEDHVATWRALQQADSAVANPSFCPEFTQLAATVRNDVEVAMLRAGQRTVGFFPFHRGPGDIGLPVGSVLTDMHGLIFKRDQTWEPLQLLQACGLRAWKFDHLVASQQEFAPYFECVEDAPYIDLTEGYEAYTEHLRARGSSVVKRARSKARRLARDIGPVRLEMHEPAALDTILDWKRRQVAAQGHDDIFATEWVVEMLRAVCRTRTASFSGLVSGLYAGDTLIAGLFGMRCRHVMSAWIPTLNPDFGKYSPGLLLHLAWAEQAAADGVTRIDLGRGENQLKTSLQSGAIPLALGAVDRRPLHRLVRHGWFAVRKLVYATPLRGIPLQTYRRLRNWTAPFSK